MQTHVCMNGYRCHARRTTYQQQCRNMYNPDEKLHLKKDRTGQSYEDSIQELNNLIGELDNFQREHENKVQQKLHDSQPTNESFMCSSNSRATPSELCNQMENMAINGDVSLHILNTRMLHSSTSKYNGDDDLETLADCHVTTASLKKNLSITEHPLMMHSMNDGSAATTSSPSMNVARSIELVPSTFHATANYVKKHSEIVVLQRKNSQSELASIDLDSGHLVLPENGASNVERTSSFRCSSFSGKLDPNAKGALIVEPTAETMHPLDTVDSGNNVAFTHTFDLHDEMDKDTMAQTRKKPVINQRPASLSGWFFFYCFFYIFKFALTTPNVNNNRIQNLGE